MSQPASTPTASHPLVTLPAHGSIPIAQMRSVYRCDEVEKRLNKLPPSKPSSKPRNSSPPAARQPARRRRSILQEHPMTRVAFIGLGNMGGPMAANLIKAGHKVTAFDLVAASRDQAKADGAVVLIGDGESPHLLKWARALSPHVDLWAVSSRSFLPGFDALLPAARRLALQTTPRFEGGNLRLLASLPRVARWLRPIKADWLHAHYLSSHGTLAWLAKGLGVRGQLCASAWGSDILVSPQRSVALAWLTRRVLGASRLATSARPQASAATARR